MINAGSSLKEQWLNFLVNCNDQKTVPENVSEIIKLGYEIMKIAKWSQEEKENYELSKIKEAYRLKELENIEKNAFHQGLEQGIKEGELKGKWKGEVKGEIKQIRSLLKHGVEPEKIKEELKILNQGKNLEKFEFNCQYIREHTGDTESQIMGDLDIEMTDL